MAVHNSFYKKLFDASFFTTPEPGKTPSYLATLTAALTLTGGATKSSSKEHTHAFTILARVLADERLEAGKTCTKESETDACASAEPLTLLRQHSQQAVTIITGDPSLRHIQRQCS